MIELTPKAKLSIGAAVIGAISLFLPWMAMVVTIPTGYEPTVTYVGESPLQLLGALLSPYQPSTGTDPGLLAWQQMAVVGYGFWTIGTVLFATGCVLLVGQAFSSIRWAGLWLVLGTFMSGFGIASFPSSFAYQGGQADVGVSFGLAVAVLAAVLGIIPLVHPDPGDRWMPQWKAEAQALDYLPRPEPAKRVPGAGPNDAAFADVSPAVDPAGRQFCPTCGRWYLSGEVTCKRDGTALKPVPAFN